MGNDILQLDEKSADDFWRLRIELFEELGESPKDTDIFQLESATKQYYLSHINKDLISWGIFQKEKIAAIGSLCLFTRIPYKENLSGLEGYILNIYTSPQFRKRGFANQILDNIIKYSQKNNIKRLWLNSSEQGKKIYAERGFVKKENEMELFL
ncbi:MAG: GNAT family N-acetyltransferase [Lachnospiraceae bacterium]|nr:GNAT family N-acetyltransferase [Lachnospiraceae bacterium]